ncbi:MAG TPA: SpoIIE family protein phosphatase [Jatrophihabitans sp.]|nr:SpoIIE family protein phosphatase [Jatrophihabitans sp.]
MRGPALFAVVALGYAIGSGTALWLLHPDLGAIFYPPSGVTLAALVLTRRRLWPWALAAAALVELVANLWLGSPLGASVGLALANTVEPLVGAGLLRASVDRPLLSLRPDLLRFVGYAVVAGPAVGGLLGTAVLVRFEHVSALGTYAPYWAGDAMGVLTVGGTILTLPLAGDWLRRQTWLAYLLTVLGAVLVTVVAFGPRRASLDYLLFPALFLVAWKRGVAGVTAAGLASTLVANVVTARGHGPWAALGQTPHEQVATLQIFLGVAVLSAWLLAVEIDAREHAQSESAAELALRRRWQALQAVTERLATAATSEQIAEIVRRDGISLVSTLGLVGIVSRDGTELRTWASPAFPAGPAAELARLRLGIDHTPMTAAARLRQPVLLSSREEIADRFPGILASYELTGARGSLQIPAMVGDTVLGVLAFRLPDEGPMDPDLVISAHALTQLTAQALDRAQLYEQDHEAAHQLQRALLPASRFDLPGVRVAAVYRPSDAAHDVGGDWYDAFALPDGRIAVAVGDVVGHDLAAAVAMGRLQAALRLVATSADGPADVLCRLDTAALTIPGALLTTLGYAEYDPASRRLRYACAGHLPPLLATGDGNRYLRGGRSTPLGLPTGRRREAALTLPPGATLFWCTDGLIERRGEDLDLGLARLSAAVGRVTATCSQAGCEQVADDLIDGPLADDAVVLCLRTEPAETIVPWTKRAGPDVLPATPS